MCIVHATKQLESAVGRRRGVGEKNIRFATWNARMQLWCVWGDPATVSSRQGLRASNYMYIHESLASGIMILID